MSERTEERRQPGALNILAVSRDEVWLQFAKKTLRRNDRVETLHGLDEVSDHVEAIEGEPLLLISSELVPSKIKELQEHLDGCKTSIVCVLREPRDQHQRINDKHLKGLGIEVADRPDNAKALRRLIKILMG